MRLCSMFHCFISSSPSMLCFLFIIYYLFYLFYTLFLVFTLIENVRLLPVLSSSKPITMCHTHQPHPSQPVTVWAVCIVTRHTLTRFTMVAISLQQLHLILFEVGWPMTLLQVASSPPPPTLRTSSFP